VTGVQTCALPISKARRINISFPERVLDAVDRFARAENETRSGLLVKAATAYIRKRPAVGKKRPPQPRRRGARG